MDNWRWKSVDLWKDWWCSNGPLADRHPGLHTQTKTKVAEIIESRIWNLTAIDHIIDTTSHNEILNVMLPGFSQAADHSTLMNSPNGNYSAAIAYDFINNENTDMKGWKWFCKMLLPQKFKTMLWLIFHNKLPTNHLRARRGIATSDLCPRCNNYPETIQHLFRDCPKVVALLDRIFPRVS